MSISPVYARITAPAPAVLDRLPVIGRVMLIASGGGVTHERIGQLDGFRIAGDRAVAHGPDHDAELSLPAIARIEIDRSSVMGEKAFPRVNFRAEGGRALFSVVSFAGMDPFDAALADLAHEALSEPVAGFDLSGMTDEAPTADPALAVLEGLVGRAAQVTVERPGFRQSWQGTVPAIKPSRGFLNILVPDFHFHLKAGAVTGWDTQPGADGGTIWRAQGEGGAALALTIEA